MATGISINVSLTFAVNRCLYERLCSVFHVQCDKMCQSRAAQAMVKVTDPSRIVKVTSMTRITIWGGSMCLYYELYCHTIAK